MAVKNAPLDDNVLSAVGQGLVAKPDPSSTAPPTDWRERQRTLAQALCNLQADASVSIAPDLAVLIAREYRRYKTGATKAPKTLRARKLALASSLAHAGTLLQDVKSGRLSDEKVEARARKLFISLTKSDLWMEVQLDPPARKLQIPAILRLLERGQVPDIRALERMEFSLVNMQGASTEKTGRPQDPRNRVVTLGYIVWLECGKLPTLTWDEAGEKALGATSSFVREFLNMFDIKVSEQALKATLVRLMRDPRLASPRRTME